MVTWVGSSVGEYNIDKKLGEGNFSVVYHGVHEQTGASAAFKVAKSKDSLGSDGSKTTSLPTQAVATITGGTMRVKPVAASLLAKQHELLANFDEVSLVSVNDLSSRPELTYYEMEYLHGPTLRELMQSKPISIEKMMDVSRCLDKLGKNPKWIHHGDIKPDNIVFSSSGVVLIDPGYFGRLDLENGSNLPDCAVTTPAYYPQLQPDDVFAFGIMLWEAVFGIQPLNADTSSESSDLSRVGEKLLETVKLQEGVGKYFLSPILDVRCPSETNPNVDHNVESLLLKALRLVKTAKGIELDAGFRSFGAISGALAALRLRGREFFLDS